MKGYCSSCEKYVQGIRKPWSWLAFLVWIWTFGIVYIIYHLSKPKDKCPMCGLPIGEKVSDKVENGHK